MKEAGHICQDILAQHMGVKGDDPETKDATEIDFGKGNAPRRSLEDV
jgi:hypothetical protein